MRAMLLVGLVNAHKRGIAPRLLTERGEIVVAAPLPRDRRPTDLAERVTYLAGLVREGPGAYDVEIANDGVPLLGSKHEPSEAARAILASHGWSLP